MLPGDLHYDIVHGICKLQLANRGSGTPAEARGSGSTELENIEALVAGLVDESTPSTRSEGIIERLYGYRSKLSLDKQKMLHGNEHFKIDDGTWQQKLVETAHLGTVMGWNDPTTVRALDEFALMSVNEVVCGKVTPLTMKQARELPEWDQWRDSMRSELKSLHDMGTFELVQRNQVPRKHRIIKTKFVYKIKQNSH